MSMMEYASNLVPLQVLAQGGGVLAVITDIVGTSYRTLGTMMAFAPDGTRAGSLSSGCIEDDIADHAQRALISGQACTLRYGAGSPFFDLKLPCGGGLSILLVPNPDRDLLAQIVARSQGRQTTDLALHLTSGALRIVEKAALTPPEMLLRLEPELRFWVFGHGIEAMTFALMAHAAGYDVRLFGQEKLHSDLTRLGDLPLQTVASFRSFVCPVPDYRTAVTLFFHDHENEARILQQVLGSPAFYIGAQGSLRARQSLIAELHQLGVTEPALRHLNPTFGLIPSCRDPRSLAVSVLAHVLASAARDDTRP